MRLEIEAKEVVQNLKYRQFERKSLMMEARKATNSTKVMNVTRKKDGKGRG